MTGSFLADPPVSPQVQKALFELMSQALRPSGLTFRQCGILVTATASALGDSYCSLAWGGRLGKAAADVQALRDAGLGDGQIFAITAYVALRLAFATINDALGAQPDAALAQSLPPEVRDAVSYGRPVAQAPA